MKRFLQLLIVSLLFSCSNNNQTSFQAETFLIPNAQIILRSPDIQSFQKQLTENEILSHIETDLPKRLSDNLFFLKYYRTKGESVLSFTKKTNEKTSYIFAGKLDSILVNFDSISEKKIETIKTKGYEFQKINLKESQFTLYQTGDIVIFSDRYQEILKLLETEKQLSPELSKIFDTTDPKKTSLFINKDQFPESILAHLNILEFDQFKTIANWIAVDIDITDNSLVLNGITIPEKNAEIFDLFSGSNPNATENLQVTPLNFKDFYSVSVEDFSKTILSDSISTPTKMSELADAREISLVNFEKGNAVIASFSEAEMAEKFMAGFGKKVDEYRNYSIFDLEKDPFSEADFSPLLKMQRMTRYTIIGHFVVLADSEEMLEEIILASSNKRTFADSPVFQNTFNLLSTSSHQLFLKQLENNMSAGMQLIYEDDYAHFHAYITKESNQNGSKLSEVSLSNTFKLGTALATNPVFFRNHNSDQMDIAVQDDQNQLQLISNKGTVFWKKKLETQIESPIFEVDLFKNGYKQLAFSTGYDLVILDRNGNRVKPFPVQFNDALTQPLAVFDYDNNRNYRFVLTQDKSLFMIGPKGKTIKGFDFEKASATITKSPKHIRLGNKDYILVSEDSGKLNILSRQGTIRVPLSEKIAVSENDWYGFDGKFITFNKSNQLVEITQTGNVKQSDIGLAENARLVANDKNMVYLSENQLHINDRVIELDFGLYSDPQLFEVKNRTFVSIRDTQTQKIYLFDREANLLEGFPVFGTSQVDISNADVDSKFEMVTKGEENEILIYEF